MKDAGIMEDDLIAVKKTQDIRNGDIVIARIDDEVTVKYFHRYSPKIVYLQPANEDFNDIEVDLEHTELFIEGKSVGLIREN
jgi:repressor LexA